jgi:hypothetical protein
MFWPCLWTKRRRPIMHGTTAQLHNSNKYPPGAVRQGDASRPYFLEDCRDAETSKRASWQPASSLARWQRIPTVQTLRWPRPDSHLRCPRTGLERDKRCRQTCWCDCRGPEPGFLCATGPPPAVRTALQRDKVVAGHPPSARRQGAAGEFWGCLESAIRCVSTSTLCTTCWLPSP